MNIIMYSLTVTVLNKNINSTLTKTYQVKYQIGQIAEAGMKFKRATFNKELSILNQKSFDNKKISYLF